MFTLRLACTVQCTLYKLYYNAAAYMQYKYCTLSNLRASHYYYLHISSIVGSEEYGEPHHQPPQEFPWSGFGSAEERYC